MTVGVCDVEGTSFQCCDAQVKAVFQDLPLP